MKNLVLFFVFLAITSTVSAKCYQVKKWNGTPHTGLPTTYGKFRESELPVDGKWQLDCYDPGTKPCKHSDGTTFPIWIDNQPFDLDAVMDIVETEVASGNFSGNVVGDGNVGYYSWIVVNSNDYELIFDNGIAE